MSESPVIRGSRRRWGRVQAFVFMTMAASLVGSVAEGILAASPAGAFGAPTHMAVIEQPTPVQSIAGQTFTTKVAIEDSQNNIVTSSTDSLEMDFSVYAPNAVLKCNGTNSSTVAAVNGVATFNCQIDQTGDYYFGVSDMTNTGLGTVAVSQVEEVTPGPATQLAFSLQPANAAVNAQIPVDVVAEDKYGNVDYNDNSDVVNLALAGGAYAANLTCTPSSSSTTVSFGAADFNCAIDTLGTGYTLLASNPGGSLTHRTSLPFNIDESVAMTTSPNPVVSFDGTGTYTVSMSLTDANGHPLANEAVELDGENAYSGTTDSNGDASFTITCPTDQTPYSLQAIDDTSGDQLGLVTEDCINIQLSTQDPIGQSDSIAITGAQPNAPVTLGFGATAGATPTVATESGTCTTDSNGSLNFGSCNFVVPSVPGVTAPANVFATVTIGSNSYQTSPFLLQQPTSIVLTPTSGPAGTDVSASVSGFASGEEVDIYYGAAGVINGHCDADPSGSCSTSFTVPANPAGSYVVEADGTASSEFADTNFNETSAISLSPASGAADSSFTMSATGFGAFEVVNLTFGGASLGQCTTNASGSCSTGAQVPGNASGPTTVTATGTSSGDTASATFVVPSVTLSPTTGPGGTIISATVGGFNPGETVDVSYNAVRQGSCSALPNGSCTVQVTAPAAEQHNYSVNAVGEASGFRASATFALTATLFLSPTTGAPDTFFTAYVNGYLPGETVNIQVGGHNVVNCSPDSTGSCSVLVPAPAGGPGAYTVAALGATSRISESATFTETGAALALSPTSGPAGTTVNASATGFLGQEVVDFSYNGTQLSQCTAGGNGNCTASLTIPADPGGTYIVSAHGTSSNANATANFNETPSLQLSLPAATAGATDNAIASGYASGDTVDVSYDNEFVGSCSADPTGGCTAQFTVPAIAPGAHTVTATGAPSGLVATASFNQTVSMRLTPVLGGVGTTFQAIGAGFQPAETVDIDFNNTLVRQCQAGTDGSCVATVTVPGLPVATYPVTMTGYTSGATATQNFSIVPVLTLTPGSGAPGSSYTASVTGFPADREIYIYFGGNGTPIQCGTDTTGACHVSGVVPPYAAGSVEVAAYELVSAETALSSFDVIPGVTLNPTSGVAGSTITVSSVGFSSNGQPLHILYGGVSAGTCPGTDNNGACSTSITVPSGQANGAETVLVFDGHGLNASATFDQTSANLLTLSPNSGTQGQSFTANISGFTPNQNVTVSFGGQSAGGCATDSAGSCSTTAFAPVNLPAGSYSVSATDTAGDSAVANFNLEPSLSVSPSSGRAGSGFTIAASGYAAGENVSFKFGNVSLGAGCMADGSGACLTSANVPNGLAGGSYQVTGTGGTSGLTSSAQFTETGSVSLNPTSGPAGTVVSANATGFEPGESVDIYYDNVLLTNCQADTITGNCSAIITIPTGAGGAHAFKAVGVDSGGTDSATFTLTGGIAVNPSSGIQGATFTATVSGFKAGQSVNVSVGGVPEGSLCTTDATGSCSGSATVPNSLPAGSYNVTSSDSSGDSGAATFQVEPALSVVPNSGPAGSSFMAEASGFAANETISLSFSGASENVGCVANAAGDCTMPPATVPSGLSAGGYSVAGTGQTSRLVALDTFYETGSLQLAPSSGPGGSATLAEATGFASGETVNFAFDSSADGGCTANANGACATSIPVPSGIHGIHTVKATGGSSGNVATTSFTVTGSLAVSPSSGNQGQNFTATVSGFTPAQSVNVSFGGVSEGSLCTTDSTGSCSGQPSVPTSLPAGSYNVVANDTVGDSGTATFQVEPSLSVSPSSGQRGSPFIAEVSGFGANESVSFTLGGISLAQSCLTDGSGSCTSPENVPNGLVGKTYTVLATGQATSLTASAQFTETGSVSLNPTSGPLGTVVSANATGFEPGESVDFYYDNLLLTNCQADTITGNCSAIITIPAGPGGAQVIKAVGVDSGGMDSATFTLTGGVAVSPSSGIQGTNLTATVSGFKAGQSVNVSVGGVAEGSLCTTDATGSCSGSATVPNSLPAGSYNVTASDSAGDSAAATFQVEPALSVVPNSGPAGSSFTAEVSGFAADETVSLGFSGTSENVSCVANAAGDCTMPPATVPSGLAPGGYSVAGTGQTSGLVATTPFTVTLAPPTVTGVSPSSGPIAGGNVVTITGSGFASPASVNFGSVASPSVQVVSLTTIKATVPTGSAGSVNVTVTTQGGTSATSAADQFTYTSVPTVTVVAPNAGKIGGGTTVTITGTAFVAGATVRFGTAAATNVTVVNPTTITATSPAGNGTVDVTVKTAGGTSATAAADQFTYLPAPTVTGVSPTSGPLAGGNVVTITGTGFASPASVNFGTAASPGVQVVSSTTVKATVPAGSAGNVNVTVTTPGGTSGTVAADKYTYLAVPTVTSIAPAAGPIAGGTSVTISGANYVAGATVSFGGSPATNVTVSNAGKITATAPAGTGTVDITVTTPGGTSATSAADQFTYDQAPTVTSVAPNEGRLNGGAAVTVTGTNFVTGATVHFGAAGGTTVTVVNPTTITVNSPAGTGSVDVTVTTPGGTSGTSAGDIFSYLPAPTVTGVSPASGPLAGGNVVTITGTGFASPASVAFGAGNPSPSVQVVSSTTIKATVPAGSAGGVNVLVTTPGGTSGAVAADKYTYLAAPTVTAVVPAAGPVVGGTSVTISGTSFVVGATVSFGGSPATNITVAGAGKITCTAPAGTGTVDVTVSTPGGTSATSAADHFTYDSSPTVTTISPDEGRLSGGTAVTITGTTFVAGTTVHFGNAAGTSVNVVNPTTITVNSPAGTGSVDVTVTTPGGTSTTSAADQFTYLPAPTVSGLSPNSGALAGGNVVTITGTGFASPATVAFGTKQSPNVQVLNATTIQATVPAGAAGNVNVLVTTPGGTSGAVAADKYTYLVAPAVTSISPSAGPVGGGTTVTINGSGFVAGATVSFGANPAGSVTFVSATRLTATSPGGTGAAAVTVTTPGGTSVSSPIFSFSYMAKPAIVAVSPTLGRTSGGTPVMISGQHFVAGLAVHFGSAAATHVTVVSSSTLKVAAPAGPAGTVNVTVTSPGGTSRVVAADRYRYA